MVKEYVHKKPARSKLQAEETLKMEAVGSSEEFASFYRNACH
jgi:hypothetical protein